jgi:hypothetical protein
MSKKCKECRDPFEPRFSTLEKYCWKHECKFIEAMQKVEQKKKSESKEWSERKSKLKKELLTKSDYIKILQQLVNKWIRKRDGNFCISCNKISNGKIDAGHMFSVGNYPSVRFDVRNINSQCIRCNQYNGGSIIEYRENLIKKIGLIEFEDLNTLAHRNRIFDIEELKEMIIIYKNKLK